MRSAGPLHGYGTGEGHQMAIGRPRRQLRCSRSPRTGHGRRSPLAVHVARATYTDKRGTVVTASTMDACAHKRLRMRVLARFKVCNEIKRSDRRMFHGYCLSVCARPCAWRHLEPCCPSTDRASRLSRNPNVTYVTQDTPHQNNRITSPHRAAQSLDRQEDTGVRSVAEDPEEPRTRIWGNLGDRKDQGCGMQPGG
jgi:hypothetical protein